VVEGANYLSQSESCVDLLTPSQLEKTENYETNPTKPFRFCKMTFCEFIVLPVFRPGIRYDSGHRCKTTLLEEAQPPADRMQSDGEESLGGLHAALFCALHEAQTMVVNPLFHLTHQIQMTREGRPDAAILVVCWPSSPGRPANSNRRFSLKHFSFAGGVTMWQRHSTVFEIKQEIPV
jgi:hypothetical protein